MNRTIFCCGLTPLEMRILRSCIDKCERNQLRIVTLQKLPKKSEMPEDSALIISSKYGQELNSWEDENDEDVRLVFLYLSQGYPVEEDWYGYDYEIQNDNLMKLKRWFDCPKVVEARYAGSSVNLSVTQMGSIWQARDLPAFMAKRVQLLDVIYFIDEEYESPQFRNHLKVCEACLDMFFESAFEWYLAKNPEKMFKL